MYGTHTVADEAANPTREDVENEDEAVNVVASKATSKATSRRSRNDEHRTW